MCRPKSLARLALEHDRAVRKARREQKREQALRRAEERAKRKYFRELCATRELRPPQTSTGIMAKIGKRDFLRYCESCHQAKRESEMKTEILCEGCFYTSLLGGAFKGIKKLDGWQKVGSGRGEVSAIGEPVSCVTPLLLPAWRGDSDKEDI